MVADIHSLLTKLFLNSLLECIVTRNRTCRMVPCARDFLYPLMLSFMNSFGRHRMRPPAASLFFAVLYMMLRIICPEACLAQEKTPTDLKPVERPRARIGVALEGGGALGLAHIGVLKWFEAHHIPVDYIAGTSMGGLVGGFYAAGKS